MIKVGLIGLGRMGKIYADILHHSVSQASLVAACSLQPSELAYARSIGIPSVYNQVDEMLSKESLDVLWVVSSTDQHVDHIIKGLEAGCHVFSEKPLATTTAKCLQVQEAADRYPQQKVMIGFVRRYDESYRYAYDKIQSGAIGKPFLIRSQTVDKDDVEEFQIQYAGKSGGIFHDYNIHDIDLTRWLTGTEFSSVSALGGAYKYPAFADMGDADNVVTSCELLDGSLAVIIASRTAMHGHDTYTEITGTKGSLLIGRPAQRNRVEIYDEYGARRECLDGYMDRFSQAFVDMSKDFIDIIRQDREVMMDITNALKATEAAIAFTSSFREKRRVRIEPI